jgi:hypothetical protein
MMLKRIASDFCELFFYERYVITRVFENVILDTEKVNFIRAKNREHFLNNDFVIIADRNLKHDLDLSIYKKGITKKLKGVAIVSKNVEEKERAIKEQELFDNSFAFFEDIEEAKSWAESFFRK